MRTPDWIDAYGRHIQLSAMTFDHIRNAMRYIVRGDGELGPLLRGGCSGFANAEWVRLMEAELMLRALTGRE
jgi:hypothetical protein